MPSINKLLSGQWRAQIRRGGHSLTRTFRLKAEADAWARDQEGRIDKGETRMGRMPASRGTLADLIELHFADMAEVGRVFGRSKEATLLRLKDTIGATAVSNLTRDMLVQFAKQGVWLSAKDYSQVHVTNDQPDSAEAGAVAL